jgi:hypothetical protein
MIRGEEGDDVWVAAAFGILSIVLSGALLGSCFLFNATPPRWLAYLANPSAWVANAIGITDELPSIVLGAAGPAMYVGSLIGAPAIGAYAAFLAYFVVRCTRWGRFRFAIPLDMLLLVSMQFAFQRGLLSLADRSREAAASPSGADRDETQRGELRALLRAQEMSFDAGLPFILGDVKATMRLMHLASLVSNPEGFAKTSPFTLTVDQVQLEISSEYPVIVGGERGVSSRHLANFSAVLQSQGVAADVAALKELSTFDPALQFGMNAVIATATNLRLLGAFDTSVRADLKARRPTIHITLRPGEGRVAGADYIAGPAADGGVAASYDAFSKTITLAIPTGLNESMWEAMLLVPPARDAAPAQFTKLASSLSQAWGERVDVPLAHELWHALSRETDAYRDMPAAIDEGMASAVQIMTERMAAPMAHSLQDVAAQAHEMPTARHTATIMAQARQESARTERQFASALRAAGPNGLVHLPYLLLLPGISDRKDVTLAYAEGWALVPSLVGAARRRVFMSSLARARDGRMADGDEGYWKELESSILENADWMDQMFSEMK